MTAKKSPVRLILRWVLGLFYLAAGIIHLRSPKGFIAITPHWVPDIPLVIALTGMAEIAGALALLLVPPLRKAAAIGLALYAICVFPANINQAINDIPMGSHHMSWWYHGPRLLMQPVLVWLALWVGDVIDWPFGRGNA
ncbi:MAG: DoxX family protein [Pseudomonadota bacterium]|nr:DoxX family protein [Pseudomonadota bacterium]